METSQMRTIPLQSQPNNLIYFQIVNLPIKINPRQVKNNNDYSGLIISHYKAL